MQLHQANTELMPFNIPIPELDEALLGQLPAMHSLGSMLYDPCWAERFHVDARTELLYVRRGVIHLETREAKVTAGPGELLLLPAGIEHRDVFDPEQGLEVFLAQFNWPGIAELAAALGNQYRVSCRNGAARKSP